MLNLFEDKALLSQLISNYLKENNIQQWKFETLMRRLLDQELEIEPTDENLLEIGNLYKQEIIQYSKDHKSQLTQAEKEKIDALGDFVSVICVAKQIKCMVKEAIFSSNYIQQLKDHALSSAIQSQQQEEKQQEKHPFNSLSSNEKMIIIIKKFGTKGYFDLMTDKIPKRLSKYMQSIKTDLSLNLQLKATSQERYMLIKISRCNCAADVEVLLQEFFSMRQLSPNSKFIRLALASAQTLWESKQLLKGSHNEDWYRLHVYSYIFDKAFINDEEFEAKRSVCYSNITKLFPDEPDQRIDFILRNINDNSDLISTEKPGRKGVKSDLEKGKAIQKMMLKKWLKEIGSIKVLNKLEAITCQWEGTKLTIFATRTLTPDHTITYKKGTFSVPKSFNHLAELSKLILAVLSLRRLVLSNYEKMNLIIKEKQREKLLLLDLEDEDSLCLRSDSTYDSVEYDVGDDDNCKMDGDLEAEILKKIEEIDNDEDLKSCSNWQEFMMEKVVRKKRKLNEEQ